MAATLPYAPTARLLRLILPLDAGNAPSTVRRRTLAVGQRLNEELDEADTVGEPVARSKRRKKPVTIVGLDSGYVHDCRPRAERAFEVVVGRILGDKNASRSIGFVRSLERNAAASHRLKRRVQEQGHRSDNVTVFSDGDTGLRCLQMTAFPKATHILDWYHLTRRLTVLKRVLYGEEAINQIPTNYHDPLCKTLTSMKWRLWHGYVGGVSNRIKAFLFTLRLPTITRKRPAVRLRRLVKELERYLNSNADSLTNYGRRYRKGQRISTAFMESAVNQLIDKRMSKSQQMRWSPTGAHALLQVRAELVDGKLDQTFARWYPGFEAPNTAMRLAA